MSCWADVSDHPEDMAMLIKRAIGSEMESLQETVASRLKDSLEQALSPIEKHLAENGTIIKSLNEELEDHAEKFNTVFNRMDSIQANVRQSEKDSSTCLTELTRLQKKINELEDRSRSNNVRLVNLPVGAEGENPRGYLQKMLPKWILSLKSSHSNLEVEKAHYIFSNNTSGPRTMIFMIHDFCIMLTGRQSWRVLGRLTHLSLMARCGSSLTSARGRCGSVRHTGRPAPNYDKKE